MGIVEADLDLPVIIGAIGLNEAMGLPTLVIKGS